MEKNQGFTLIELVIVIVILGILAATAAPKFIDLASDAKKANRSALLGAIKSAMELAHMKCATDADCNMSGASSIEVGGETIRMNNGYPLPDFRPQAYGIGFLVDTDWETATDSSYQLWWYPGTTRAESDCMIEYRLGNPPTFTTIQDGGNGRGDVTCS